MNNISWLLNKAKYAYAPNKGRLITVKKKFKKVGFIEIYIGEFAEKSYFLG